MLRLRSMNVFIDRLNHAINIGQHFPVGKSENSVTFLLQESIPLHVMCNAFLTVVLAAINLDDQHRTHTQEIAEVGPFGYFPAEMHT